VNAIDIILLGLFLFFAFRFIRGRKAGVLLIGILIFFLIQALAFVFELNATYFVFSQMFKVGAIAIVIIFQPEIRDALEKIGSGSLGSILSISDHKKTRLLYQNAINHIASAVMDLSASKTGALIVISRTTKLDDIIESGIKINADVNSSLLRNLFYNKAPLHDGAVVIDEARIMAASCLLPLTRRTDIDSDLGTRHRAALGMSESSDAVVIIVSEETGTISIAFDCELTRNYNYESLKRFLCEKIIGT
jgi:diadenylate cyclase